MKQKMKAPSNSPASGVPPRMAVSRITQQQLSRAKQGENHEMMAFERETLRSNWPFNKDVIARAEEQISTYHMKGCMLRMRYLYSPCSFGHFLQQRV